MEKFNILLAMIFCHFLFDFYIQSKSNALIKKKDWWENRHKNPGRRKYNYIFGLMIHSYVWTFSILLPSYYITGDINYFLLFGNTIIHAVVDNGKSNRKTISSVADQIIHLGQILVTWIILEYL